MSRVRYFIDPSKSDEEIAKAILAMPVEHEIDVPEDQPGQARSGKPQTPDNKRGSGEQRRKDVSAD